eukprot:COSAG02_NODE_21949_length_769_cov_0.919403_1_plen_100_part_10
MDLQVHTESTSDDAGVDNPVFEEEGVIEESDLIVCEHLLAKADAFLTNEAGRPSAFFWAMILMSIPFMAGFWVGAFWCPCGAIDCYTGDIGDPMLASAQV